VPLPGLVCIELAKQLGRRVILAAPVRRVVRGCPPFLMPPGVLLDFGTALRKPIGRIHFAGSETSPFWAGYMDGAVRSGERAAKDALAAL
jgi:hypothetical protein